MDKKKIILNFCFAFGLGILVHDYAHALWQVGGYREILSLQGGYFGLLLVIFSWLLLHSKELKKILNKKRKREVA